MCALKYFILVGTFFLIAQICGIIVIQREANITTNRDYTEIVDIPADASFSSMIIPFLRHAPKLSSNYAALLCPKYFPSWANGAAPFEPTFVIICKKRTVTKV